MSLLSVENLSIALPFGGERDDAVTGISFALDPGEILCLVGESGSGKSVSAAAIMGLLAPGLAVRSGAIEVEGRTLRLGLASGRSSGAISPRSRAVTGSNQPSVCSLTIS